MLDEWGADQETGVEPAGVRGSEWRSEPEWEGGAHLPMVMAVCVCILGGGLYRLPRGSWQAHRDPEEMGTAGHLQSTRAVHLAGVNGFPPPWCFCNLC